MTSFSLTKTQKLGLGKYHSFFSSKYLQYHSKLCSENIKSDDELQPIQEFEEMGNRKPNQNGTGRNLITKKRSTIYLMKLGKKFNIDFKILRELISAYFGTEVKLLETGLKLKIIDKVISVIDAKKNLSFPLKNQKNHRIDVFSLFDILTEYVPKDCYSLITITDYDIYDPDIPEDEIYGRACGDRVAVIHDLEDVKTTMMTVMHEVLHTIGIDHCVAWKCLMNAFVVDTFDICPMDLKKLEIARKFDLREREEKMLKIFKKLGYKEEIRLTLKKIQILKKLN